jgi:hypothetical protein
MSLSNIAKEEILKQFIDKLLFGLIAAILIYSMQQYTDSNTRKQIEKEAILKLESSFILREAEILQKSFSEYLSILIVPINLGLPVKNEDNHRLLVLRINMESSIDILSINDKSIKTKSKHFLSKIASLSHEIRTFELKKVLQYKEESEKLKIKYSELVAVIRNSAIKSISKNNI